jgi:diguanylate cyclase (GGDEF)-like protein
MTTSPTVPSSDGFSFEGLPYLAKFGLHLAGITLIVVVAYAAESFVELHESLHNLLEEYDEAGIQVDAMYLAITAALPVYFGFLFYFSRKSAIERKKSEAAALEMAFTDALTGLSNRRGLLHAVEEIARSGKGCLALIDLNHFKPVNDLFGHAVGDKLLVQCAERLKTLCVRGETVCRIGGDEFAVVSSAATTSMEIDQFATGLATAFEMPFDLGEASEVKAGASIGLYQCTGAEGVDEIIRRADIALYKAKRRAQESFLVFQPLMETELRRSKELEARLTEAVRLGDIVPHFQPLIDLKTKRLIGFEALARWTDKRFGYVSPGEFIPLAEEMGLITELSERVFRYACEQAVKWPKHLCLSINISQIQLSDPLLGLRIIEIIASTGLSPRQVEIEITESSLAKHRNLAITLLRNMRAAGVRVAIDDFGTGYSNLYQLRDIKFDNLKIDKAFTDELNKSWESKVIVNAILSLSRGLGATATAEGIETPTQLEQLIEAGCQNGQGFLFSKAVPAEEALRLIEKDAREEAGKEALTA